MTGIHLVEHAPAVRLPLPAAVGQALTASRIVEAAPDPVLPGHWRLRAGSKVGAVTFRLPGTQAFTLRITPKVPVARLFFLMGYALSPSAAPTGHDVDTAEHTEVLPAFAHAYERQLSRALGQGLVQGYRTTEESALVVRGRVREADQIRRRFGQPLPVEITYDAYTTDIPENRILRAATERLLRMPDVPHDVRRRLAHHRARFSDVAPLVRGQALPAWRPTRLNARCHRALRLAEALLRGASSEHGEGALRVEGFLFDMNKLFEDFLCTALREALAAYGGRTELQAKDIHLDHDGTVRMRPDLVWYADQGPARAVVDAKYKAQKPEGFPEADLYQMLAYCTALGLPEGHLVYAKGTEPHTVHRVRNTGITLHQHALDLDQPPNALLRDIGDLAEQLAISALV
ncbi:McrC family protein [Streptomyces roseolus]|uniref:McrC family protein n=1 Tax=Streptomyces roseolus TaxID=67358 RepID=UPI00167387FF|nr:restriction endonuclease [Streptomyces roseolus]GGR26372.1 McrBC 5-methylcytosine restriction system component [Streptomyces roseolus]